MRPFRNANNVLAGLVATLLLGTGGMAQAAQTVPALTAEHVIACIRSAASAQAGAIKEVDVEYKRGQWLCEVDIVDDTGQEYELSIDVTTYQVVKTERD